MKPIPRIRTLKKQVGTGRFTRVGDVPRTLRPTETEPLRIPDLPDDIILYRRTNAYKMDEQAALELRAVNINRVYGSVHERIFFRELEKRRLQHGIHFLFQASMEGARPRGMRVGGRQLGGIVVDFAFIDRPMVVQVQGGFWHRFRSAEIRDRVQAQRLNERGWHVEFIEDYELEDPFLTEEWLKRHVDRRVLGSVPAGFAPVSSYGVVR